jgi:hypothetical protein
LKSDEAPVFATSASAKCLRVAVLAQVRANTLIAVAIDVRSRAVREVREIAGAAAHVAIVGAAFANRGRNQRTRDDAAE